MGARRDLELPDTPGRAPVATGPYEHEILVPFAPESTLSGIGTTEFIDSMDYHRTFTVPQSWGDRRTLLHFGGVDAHADVYVNGEWAGSHSGGSSPFALDITRHVRPGSAADLTVAVRDFINAGNQGGGKQTHYAQSYGCYYTRTTGVWQSVWLEAVHPAGLASVWIVPNAATGSFAFTPRYLRHDPAASLSVVVSCEGVELARTETPCRDGVPFVVPVPDPDLWYPGRPVLYDLHFRVMNGEHQIDAVTSYSALRDITLHDGRFHINGKSVYLRFVLDQGFYPDGIWTAPTDDALRRDIQLSMAAGFNGARLHQKVFESRYHYWADRLGYLTWSEWPSWGLDYTDYSSARAFQTEVRDVVMDLRNHPSIIAWTPFNETRNRRNPRSHYLNHVDAAMTCRQLDPSRPVNDSSGYIHHQTDIYTVHSYAPTAEELRERLAPDPDGQPFRNVPDSDAPYEGQPYIVDEFGGVKWTGELPEEDENANRKDDTKAWGYGGTPRTHDEFFGRLSGLVETITDMNHIAGWCYTQLTDVEQEQNGVYCYDRSEKFPESDWRRVLTRRPDGFDL